MNTGTIYPKEFYFLKHSLAGTDIIEDCGDYFMFGIYDK